MVNRFLHMGPHNRSSEQCSATVRQKQPRLCRISSRRIFDWPNMDRLDYAYQLDGHGFHIPWVPPPKELWAFLVHTSFVYRLLRVLVHARNLLHDPHRFCALLLGDWRILSVLDLWRCYLSGWENCTRDSRPTQDLYLQGDSASK